MKGKISNQNRFGKTQISLFSFIAVILIISFLTFTFTDKPSTNKVDDYASCIEANGDSKATKPPECSLNGKTFTFSMDSIPLSYTQIDTFYGQVTAIDYSALKSGGHVQITVQDKDSSSYGFFVATSGDCNEETKKMMQAKKIQVGDSVEVSTKLGSEKTVNGLNVDKAGYGLVCDNGTYIKKLQ